MSSPNSKETMRASERNILKAEWRLCMWIWRSRFSREEVCENGWDLNSILCCYWFRQLWCWKYYCPIQRYYGARNHTDIRTKYTY